ncbi:MAG: hypothetical protein AB1657_01575 [Candidatus Micrarchaeota archaeon]
MVQQVKVRIFQPSVLQNRLKLIGAAFLGAWNEKDTYFLQPAGCFLKIKRRKDSAFLVKLRRNGGGAFRKEVRRLADPGRREKELAEKFGVMNVIEKRVRAYGYKGSALGIHSIPELGDFLVIEAGFAETGEILRKLGIEKPQFVTLAFSEML